MALAFETVLRQRLEVRRMRTKQRVFGTGQSADPPPSTSLVLPQEIRSELLAAAIPSCNRYPKQYRQASAPLVSNPEGRGKERHQPSLPSVYADSQGTHCVRCSVRRQRSAAGKSDLNPGLQARCPAPTRSMEPASLRMGLSTERAISYRRSSGRRSQT